MTRKSKKKAQKFDPIESPLYERLVSSGYSEDQTFKILMEVNDNQYDYMLAVDQYEILKSIDKSVLDKVVDFNSLDLDTKNDLLWGIGLDTKAYKANVISKIVSDDDNPRNLIYKTYVVCEERSDEEWINARDAAGIHLSSQEVRDHVRSSQDEGWARDVEKLSKTGEVNYG